MARHFPDLSLVRRVQAAESGYTLSRLKVLERLPGNPAGVGAGTAILYVHQGVGYLADASTAPSARGRGIHQALLARRWKDALDAGAELVCAQAAYLSTSHRNMERAGLRLLHTQAIWMAPPLS